MSKLLTGIVCYRVVCMHTMCGKSKMEVKLSVNALYFGMCMGQLHVCVIHVGMVIVYRLQYSLECVYPLTRTNCLQGDTNGTMTSTPGESEPRLTHLSPRTNTHTITLTLTLVVLPDACLSSNSHDSPFEWNTSEHLHQLSVHVAVNIGVSVS
jgi:hypothetical protein